jgi:hypothetical protein
MERTDLRGIGRPGYKRRLGAIRDRRESDGMLQPGNSCTHAVKIKCGLTFP